MKKAYLIIAIFIFLSSGIWSCKTSKEATNHHPTTPSWISERPVKPGFYYGIGSASKKGSARIYRQKAAEKALSDIAGQISSHIESQTTLYRVEDRLGIREIFETRINSQSEDFLEGQEVIDEYQDDQAYYILYRLSATTYESKRELRRQKAFEAARQYYLSGIAQAKENEYQLSVHYLLKAIENVYPFRGEKTWVIEQNDSLDLFVDPLEKIKCLTEQLKISASTYKGKIVGDHFSGNGVSYLVIDQFNQPVAEVPIFFAASGGYLANNRDKTDTTGKCNAPALKVVEQTDPVILSAKIDLSRWVNQSTEIMEIRNLVKKWSTGSCKVELRR